MMKILGVMARKGDTQMYVSRMQQELFEAMYMMALPIERVAKFPPVPMDQEKEYLSIRRKKQKGCTGVLY